MLFPFHEKYFTSIRLLFEWISLKIFLKIFTWELADILFTNHKVRIKSIHNIGYKTAFYRVLYLLLSDSNQNILISFGPKILISYHSN